MLSDLRPIVMCFLYGEELPLNWRHNRYETYFNHVVISKCDNIIHQCSEEDFCRRYPTYCHAVEETCQRFINRENGIKEEDVVNCEWPHNIEWFDPDHLLRSFIDLLFRNAEMHAPRDGLLISLKRYIETERPAGMW